MNEHQRQSLQAEFERRRHRLDGMEHDTAYLQAEIAKHVAYAAEQNGPNKRTSEAFTKVAALETELRHQSTITTILKGQIAQIKKGSSGFTVLHSRKDTGLGPPSGDLYKGQGERHPL